MLLKLILLVVLFYVAKNIFTLVRNVQLARRIGLPYTIIPFHPYGTLSFLCKSLTTYLSGSSSKWIRFTSYGWWWNEKYAVFRDLGSDIILLVSPQTLSFYVADGDAAADIMARRLDFQKPVELYRPFELLGRNVETVEGADHRRHRRIISPLFSEKNQSVVWQQGLQQAQQTLDSWTASSEHIVRTTHEDCMQIALSVISFAGFGVKLQHAAGEDVTLAEKELLTDNHAMTWSEALRTLMDHFLLLSAVPSYALRFSPFPAQRKAAKAFDEWRQYSEELLEVANNQLGSHGTSKIGRWSMDGLLGALAMCNSQVTKNKIEDLTPDEVIGNMFILMFAGHETTATTLQFALTLLAIHPQYQKSLQEDLDRVLGNKHRSKWSYETEFVKLASGWATAIFYETLRLFAPQHTTTKCNGATWQQINFDNRIVHIPPHSEIVLDTIALHQNPKYWVKPNQSEEDAQLSEFRPDRWFRQVTPMTVPEGSSEDDILYLPQEKNTGRSLYTPPNGFTPFSGGHRACLGRRFAQAEHIAVLAVLFKDHNVELVREPQETWSDAKERALGRLKDIGGFLTERLEEDWVKLRWVPREKK